MRFAADGLTIMRFLLRLAMERNLLRLRTCRVRGRNRSLFGRTRSSISVLKIGVNFLLGLLGFNLSLELLLLPFFFFSPSVLLFFPSGRPTYPSSLHKGRRVQVVSRYRPRDRFSTCAYLNLSHLLIGGGINVRKRGCRCGRTESAPATSRPTCTTAKS